ncbi:hypothetical protein [Azospirillum sp. TSO22-1]|uniref:hypothetical protein n=1 Tax=Azospirillum sp. TSO22-1 TaxID=716789 RepID=UPI000D609824|nr:hypothetical protein [Azospirillum sp. TSO22-1]PWC55157.1 hypothetical protein TSO221_05990 [Azospirillum sp. TSO22-1]
MLIRFLIACAFSVSLAACSDSRMAGTSGSSGTYAALPSGSSAPPRAVGVGGMDNGQWLGAREGAVAGSGSSYGVGDGPPGGIANNQLDRIGQ